MCIRDRCSTYASGKVITGAERMDQYLPLIKGKRVGMVVNHTSIVGTEPIHLLDTLLKQKIDIVKVFAPEHGFRGNADAGETVKDGKDSRTGVTIVSLYGDNKKPTAAQLKDIDVILFDIQDVGARFYTYISTMYYVMEACAENKKEMIILDLSLIHICIYAAMIRTEYMVYEMYPQIKPCLPQKLHFIHSEELRQLYPNLEPKCREHAICQKYGAVFIIGIGCKLSDCLLYTSTNPSVNDVTEWINKLK